MSGARIEGDFKKLRDTLSGLQGFNFKALNKDIGEELRTQTLDRFNAQVDPDGQAWKKSIRVNSSGGQTLSDNGDLKNSIKYKASDEGVALGTNKIYAAIHQYGGPIRVKNAKCLKFNIGGRWSSKKEVEIPQRAYLGVSDENLLDINEIIEEHIKEHVEG